MSIFEKILSLFKTKQKYVFDIIKEFNLNPNIGATTPNCPYCNGKLDKFPSRKTKCKHCGKYMYIRTRCADRKKIIIKENEIELVEKEWEKIDWDKKRYLEKLADVKTNKSQKKNKQSVSMGIDASNIIKKGIEEFNKKYEQFCNYPEINSIDKADQLELLTIPWKHCCSLKHNVVPEMQVKFPQYNKQILEIIYAIESSRMVNYCHMQNYIKCALLLKNCSDFVEYYTSEESSSFYDANYKKSKQTWARLVHIKDMVNATTIYKKSNSRYIHYCYSTPLFLNSIKKPITTVFLYQKNEYTKMSIAEFKKYCKTNNCICPL